MQKFLNFIVPNDNAYIISSLIWILSLVTLCVVSFLVVAFFNYRSKREKIDLIHNWLEFLSEIATKPLLCLFALYCIYFITNISLFYFSSSQYQIIQTQLITLVNIAECAIFFWLIFNILTVGKSRLLTWAIRNNNTVISIILPAISSSLYILVYLMMMNILFSALDLPSTAAYVVDKVIKVVLIGMIGWMFVQIINAAEKFITNQYVANNKNVFVSRKIKTQLLIIKRIIMALVVIIVLAAILMLFDSVKNLGTGLLTTAGILSAIAAFASQQSLSRIFSGLHIAFAQPIRIGDTIIIDKELGQVEEITLSYVVVKLWDLRRLILPTNYFMNQGLQNLTHESSELLGTVFIYADYALPVDQVREKFYEILKSNVLWDEKVAVLDVTDIKDNCMELRGLMSAEDSTKLWSLRCQVREQLISYIVERFPECLPKTRQLKSEQG